MAGILRRVFQAELVATSQYTNILQEKQGFFNAAEN
jgi:hypothetical protein